MINVEQEKEKENYPDLQECFLRCGESYNRVFVEDNCKGLSRRKKSPKREK